jgi:hypothetical protein
LEKSLQKRVFRNSLVDAQKEIVQKQQELSRQGVGEEMKTPKTLSIDELVGIIEKKAGAHIVVDKIEVRKEEATGREEEVGVQKKEGPSDGPSIGDNHPQTRSFKI